MAAWKREFHIHVAGKVFTRTAPVLPRHDRHGAAQPRIHRQCTGFHRIGGGIKTAHFKRLDDRGHVGGEDHRPWSRTTMGSMRFSTSRT